MTLWVHVPTPVGTFILHLLVYTCAHDIDIHHTCTWCMYMYMWHTCMYVLHTRTVHTYIYESYILIHDMYIHSCVPVWLCVYTRVPVCLCATGTVVGIRVYTRSFS